MSDETPEAKTGFFAIVFGYYERVLENKTSANLLIIALLILLAIPILGIGVALMNATMPLPLLLPQ